MDSGTARPRLLIVAGLAARGFMSLAVNVGDNGCRWSFIIDSGERVASAHPIVVAARASEISLRQHQPEAEALSSVGACMSPSRLVSSIRDAAFSSRHSLVACALLLSLATPAGAQTPAQNGKPPLPFPAGYDYPANPTTLQTMIRNRDTAGLRRHGWYLWAGVNQPGYDGWPIWRSWPIATQAFAPPPSAPAQRQTSTAPAPAARLQGSSLAVLNKKNNPPINLALPFYLIPDKVRERHEKALATVSEASAIPDGENFQNNGDLMLVSEPYSRPGYDYIRANRMYLAATLNALMKANKNDITPPPPRTSIVLKHMYWPVKRDGLSALPLVDMAKYLQPARPDTTYVGFENIERWPQAVAIDPSRTTIPAGEKADVTYLYDVRQPFAGSWPLQPLGPHTYRGAMVVPITAFYHKKISLAEYEAFSEYDRVLIDASFYWAHGRVFEDGDYLVAIASHVITKEIDQWTLQSAWWHDQPNEGDYAKDRPDIPAAKGPWRHYLLVSEYGVTVRPGGNTLPIAYNPYIELASHPVETNCRNCHMRAAWPTGAYIQSPGPAALDNIGPADPIFKNLLRTDFLWTIPDRANRP
jgi:hypothetical protein